MSHRFSGKQSSFASKKQKISKPSGLWSSEAPSHSCLPRKLVWTPLRGQSSHVLRIWHHSMYLNSWEEAQCINSYELNHSSLGKGHAVWWLCLIRKPLSWAAFRETAGSASGLWLSVSYKWSQYYELTFHIDNIPPNKQNGVFRELEIPTIPKS